MAKDQYPKAIHLSLEKTVLPEANKYPNKNYIIGHQTSIIFSAIYTFTYMILYKVK